MSVLRHHREKNFTIIPNEIFKDENLNLRDIGLLCYLLHLPDEWNFSVAGLVSILPNDGRDGVMRSLNRIEAAGYLKRTRERVKGGHFSDAVWVISDSPMSENPTLVKPTQRKKESNKELKEEKRDKVLSENLQELCVEALPKFPAVSNEGRITEKKVEKLFGASAMNDALALVNDYIDIYYPHYQGKEHPPVTKRSRIVYAYRLLVCSADMYQNNLELVEDALVTAVAKEKHYDPTIFLETRPKTLGIWMIECGDLSYDLIRDTPYDFKLDGEPVMRLDETNASDFKRGYCSTSPL